MAEQLFTYLKKDQNSGNAVGAHPGRAHRLIPSDLTADLMTLQNTAGNRAADLMVRAALDSGNGQPLEPSIREFMESRFQHDFSQVRVHTDAFAAESARQIDAAAYTVGADLLFGAGNYQPMTPEGQVLLAHELVHSVQQSHNLTTSLPSGAAHEGEADRIAGRVASGTGQIAVQLTAQPGIARTPAAAPPVSKGAQGLPAAAGTLAMTPEDMFNKLVNRYFDEHIPVHQVDDAEKYLELMKKRLESMEAQFKKAPTDELKKGIKALQSDYKKMHDRIAISKLEGPGAMAGRGDETHVIIQIVDQDGYIVKDAKGNDLVAYGKNIRGGKHAEQIAMDQLEKQLGERKIPGARIVVVGDQEVCHDVCEPALKKFAQKYEIERVDGHEFKRPKITGKGEATSKQTATTATKKSSEKLELNRRSKNIYQKTGPVPAKPGGGSSSVKETPASPAKSSPETKPISGPAAVKHQKSAGKTAAAGTSKKITPAQGAVPEPGIAVSKAKAAAGGANFEGAFLASGEAEHAKIAVKSMFSNMVAGVALGMLQEEFRERIAQEVEQLPKLALDKRSLADFLTTPNSAQSANLFYLLRNNLGAFEEELVRNDALLIASFQLELVDIATTPEIEKRLSRLELINAKLEAYEDWLLIINNNLNALQLQESRFRETKEAADGLLKLLSSIVVQDFLIKNGVRYDEITEGAAILKALSSSVEVSLQETKELGSRSEKILNDEMTFARQLKKIWLSEFTEWIRLKRQQEEKPRQEAAKATADPQTPAIGVAPLR